MITPLFDNQVHVSTNNDLSWDHLFTKQNIKVCQRDFPNSRFKEFKGTIEVESSLSAFTALLMDINNMAGWLHKADEIKLVEQISPYERIAYVAFDFYPLPKRDLVVRNCINQCPETKTVTYSMDIIHNHPVLKASHRQPIQNLVSHVIAEPVSPKAIRITYQSHVEPGLKFLDLPFAGTLTNKLLSETPYKTLKKARGELRKPKYQRARFEFIENH